MHRFLIPNQYSLWLPLDNPEASNALELAIKSLASEERVLLKKKVFADKTVYTIAVNTLGKHRLIFERVILRPKNETVFVLQGIALYHDYRKALTWTPLNSLSEEALWGSHFEINRHAEIDETTCTEVYFDRQWLLPTVIQTQVLSQVSLPHLVTGPPGSGKTLVSLAFFQELALKHQASGEGLLKLLFISSQPDLNATLKRSWQEWASLSLSEKMPCIHLQFMTFSELVSWRENEEKPRELVHEETLLGLIERHQRSISCPLTAREVLSEFLVSSYVLNDKTIARYCARGINQTGVLPAHKEAIYALYHRVMLDLGDSVYPGLSVVPPCDPSFQFHYAVADEAQSVGIQDLLNVWNVTEGGKILYCGDSYQRGACKISSISLLETCIYMAFGMNLTKTMLVETHRLKPSVASLCNELVLLSNTLNEGITDKTSYSTFSAASTSDVLMSSLSWVETYTDEFRQLGRDAKSAAIVLSPQDIVTAKNYINGSNVFLVSEARGQQFSRVFLYVSSETLKMFIELNQRMQARGILSDSPLKALLHASSKKGTACEATYFEILSDLMVALSRSYGDVWVFCETESKTEQHRLGHILPWLKHRCLGHMKISVIASTQEEWLDVIHQFIQKGARQQALDNLMLHFVLDKRLANQYIALYEERGSVMSVNEGMIWLSDTIRPTLSVKAILEPSEVEMMSSLSSGRASQATSTPSVKVASNKKEKTAVTPSTPACVQKLEAEEGGSDINALMGELLVLGAPSAGKWLCSHSVRGQSVFEHIFADSKAIISLALYLAQEKKEEIFFNALSPYLSHKCLLESSSISFFQLMVLTFINKKIPPVYCSIINRALSVASAAELNASIESSRVPKGASLLFLLLSRGDGVQFTTPALVKKIRAEGLNREIESGPGKGKNLLFFLFYYLAYSWYWNEIKTHFTATGLACTVTQVDDVLKNSTPLLLLCDTNEGRLFLKNNWKYIKAKIPTELFYQPVTGDGPYQGKTPFYLLCSHSDGIRLLIDHWNDLKNTITTERLCQPITRNGPEKGYTPFFLLMVNQLGIQLISVRWTDFNGKITTEMLSNTLREGMFKGFSPLTYLFGTPVGRKLLHDYWLDFRGIISPEMFYQPVVFDIDDKEKTPLYYLCGTPDGVLMIRKHWDTFKAIITAEAVCQPVSTHEYDRGRTSLFLLCAIREGRQFVDDHWEDFFKAIFTSITLHQPVFGTYGELESSIFIKLCASGMGLEILEKHWTHFKKIITKDGLHQTVVQDSEYKGITPLHLLCEHAYGRQLLQHHWVDFKDKITPESLFARVVGKGVRKGVAPICDLVRWDDAFQLLHDNWSDFKNKLTKINLHQPIFYNGFGKETSLFYFICTSPEGRRLLKHHWQDLKDLITRESLSQHTPADVKTIFQYLSEHKEIHDLLTQLMSEQTVTRETCRFFATTTHEACSSVTNGYIDPEMSREATHQTDGGQQNNDAARAAL